MSDVINDVLKPTKVLVVMQQKGGVGKTTISRMLGIYAAREDLLNKRVLMMDFDSQASLSKLCLDMDSVAGETRPPIMEDYEEGDSSWNGRSSVADIFLSENGAIPYQVKYPYPFEHLDIMPAYKRDLHTVEECDRGPKKEAMLDRLRTFAELPEVRSNYDLIVIDTGPTDSPLVRCALRAASHVVIPVTLETQCINGLAEMMNLWRTEMENRPSSREKLIMAGLLINKYDARYAMHKMHMANLHSDPETSVLLCPEVIPQRAGIMDRDSRGSRPATLFDIAKTDDLREIALAACADIYGRVFPEETARMTTFNPSSDYASRFTTKSAATA